jgi:catechol 2,3-dioxygenase-like lactoylglutathione lyase family enzyme
MITGAHFLLYRTDPDADRQFFRDVLGFSAVDAGDGWLIFAAACRNRPPSLRQEFRSASRSARSSWGSFLSYLQRFAFNDQVVRSQGRRRDENRRGGVGTLDEHQIA